LNNFAQNGDELGPTAQVEWKLISIWFVQFLLVHLDLMFALARRVRAACVAEAISRLLDQLKRGADCLFF
jgi:hypothetical protein